MNSKLTVENHKYFRIRIDQDDWALIKASEYAGGFTLYDDTIGTDEPRFVNYNFVDLPILIRALERLEDELSKHGVWVRGIKKFKEK